MLRYDYQTFQVDEADYRLELRANHGQNEAKVVIHVSRPGRPDREWYESYHGPDALMDAEDAMFYHRWRFEDTAAEVPGWVYVGHREAYEN